MAQSIPSWAVRGAKVVCIDAYATRIDGVAELIEGEIYTIEAVRPWAGANLPKYAGLMGLVLQGIGRGQKGHYTYDRPFNLARFRPLVTRTAEQDVAMFAHHLNDVPVEA